MGNTVRRAFPIHCPPMPKPAPQPKVSVVVVDTTSLSGLQHCVHAVRTQTEFPAFDIVVASTRTSPLRNAQWTGVRWCAVPFVGVADACNRAVAATRADIVALLDSRCIAFDAGWLREAVAHARERDVGLVAANDANGAMQGVIGHGCLVVRQHVFLRESGFDPSYDDLDCATADLAMRIGLRGLQHRAVSAIGVRLRKQSLFSRLVTLHQRTHDRRRLAHAWRAAAT